MFSENKIRELYNNMTDEKNVYFYDDNDENKYTSKGVAQFDPLCSMKEEKVVLLQPANSTKKKPPKEKEGYVILFNKEFDKWEQIKDCKGEFYYDFEKSSMEEIRTHKNKDNKLILSKDDKKEIYSGKTVRLVNGKYDFYYTDEQCKNKIISDANMYLSMYDFYFNSDYPTEKIPVRMVEYREYLRGLNSEHNLKDRDVQNLKVMTYEEFAG